MAIVKHVVVEKQRPLLELIPKQCPEELIYLMKKCWEQAADNRPNFNEIVNFLEQLDKRL